MPRRKKPQPDMTDREVFKSLFPKKIRDWVTKEVELDDSEVPEKEEESEVKRPIEGEDT